MQVKEVFYPGFCTIGKELGLTRVVEHGIK